MRTEPVRAGYLSFRADEGAKEKAARVSPPDNNVVKSPSKSSLPLITAAVAIASLGVSAVAISRGNKKPAESGVEALKAELEKLKTELANKTASNDLKNKIDELAGKISQLENSGLKDELLGHINLLRETLNGISSMATSKTGFPSTMVNVNGRDFVLANILNPLKSKEQLIDEAVKAGKTINDALIHECEEKSKPLRDLNAALQSEATKRLFGLSQGLKSVPEHGVMRIPTSEFRGFASTGGMSVVPKEIADNIAKIIAGKQDMSIVVDIPLYRGAVEKSSVGSEFTEKFADLIPQSDGTYRYVQNVIKTKNGQRIENSTSTIATLRKIDSMDVRILTESQEITQKVDMYMAENRIPLDYNTAQEGFIQKVRDMINSMNPGETREFGALEVVKDENGNIKTFAKVRTVLYDNGRGGKFDLNVPVDQTTNIYNDSAIASGETERFVYFSKFFYENITKAETARIMNTHEAETIAAKIAKEKNPEKIAKMESERQAKLGEANRYLGADLILGNDWQSGPISAMMRQLTTARRFYNSIGSNVADKLYDTPIVTIMHNAELTGRNWKSQPRLLNILFGEHSASIVLNSHMPNLHVKNKNDGLESHLWNGLMDGTNVNPQMMAIAFSDMIVPVSEGYSKEIATTFAFGKERTELFKFRAREGFFYSDVENLRQLAAQNGIPTSEIRGKNPTMIGITNGADRANNTLTANKAREIERNLGLPEGTFVPYQSGTDKLIWHNRNKMAAVNKMKADINAARNLDNPQNLMQIEMPLETDLTGVTEKTPIFVSAGRIVDQKGLDILADAIKEFYKNFKGTEYPVFYIQGIGDPQYKEAILDAKREVARTNPDAAKRIVFANLFSEPGRYDLSKLVTDWSLMPSWFEPCGLSHKEIGLFSGAGSVVNRTGGLTADLHEGINVVASEFNPDRSKLHENGQSFARAIQQAIDIHADESKFRAVVESMMNANFDWAREGGPIFKYMDIFKDLGVIDKKVS